MAELIAVGNTLVNSADFTVAAGTPATLSIKGASGGVMPTGVQFILQRKGSAGNYTNIFSFDAYNIVANGMIVGSGTYRVQRHASTNSAGMDKE